MSRKCSSRGSTCMEPTGRVEWRFFTSFWSWSLNLSKKNEYFIEDNSVLISGEQSWRWASHIRTTWRSSTDTCTGLTGARTRSKWPICPSTIRPHTSSTPSQGFPMESPLTTPCTRLEETWLLPTKIVEYVNLKSVLKLWKKVHVFFSSRKDALFFY